MPELTSDRLSSLLRCPQCGVDVRVGHTEPDVTDLPAVLLDDLHQRHRHTCAAYLESRPVRWLAWAAFGVVMVLVAAFGAVVWGAVAAVHALIF